MPKARSPIVNTGATGATTLTRWVGGTASSAPTTGTFAVGDFVVTLTGKVWVCTSAGTPGTWVAISGITYSASAPSTPSVGDLWVDPTDESSPYATMDDLVAAIGAIPGAWRDITSGCTLNNINIGTTGTKIIKAKRYGREITITGDILAAGTGMALSGFFTIGIPTADAVLGNLSAVSGVVTPGSATYLNAGSAWYAGNVMIGTTNASTVDFVHAVPAAGTGIVGTNSPVTTWFNAVGDRISFAITYEAAND